MGWAQDSKAQRRKGVAGGAKDRQYPTGKGKERKGAKASPVQDANGVGQEAKGWQAH